MSTGAAHSKFQTLSIIIPVYNERSTIRRVLESVMAISLPLHKQIIVVDDFSSDGTREVLHDLPMPASGRFQQILQVVMHDRNRGKGAAIRSGMAGVTGDIVLVQDADLEYDPADYPKLLEPILSGRADAVFGN